MSKFCNTKNLQIDAKVELCPHMACVTPFLSLTIFPDPLPLPKILNIQKGEYTKYTAYETHY